jgi:hypothetical protein
VNRLSFLLILWPILAHAQYSGVTVNHYKGEALLSDQGYPIRNASFTLLSVYPQPTAQGLYSGIDLNSLAPILQLEGGRGANRISHYFMNNIQDAYFKIAESKGMLKMGSPFQKELALKEPFWDGRSAALALFEGDDFSHPLATLRVAYSTPKNPKSPLEMRLQINLDDYRTKEPISEVQPTEIDDLLGLNYDDRSAVESFAHMLQQKNDLASKAFGSLTKMFVPAISTGHKFIVLDPRVNQYTTVPFSQVLLAALKQADESGIHRPLLFGGKPAELKGLSHAQNDSRVDYMHFLFWQAVNRGYFDIIPHVNGYVIPATLSAETPVAHISGAYKDWNWRTLHKIYDPVFNGEVAIVEMTRKDLANLIPGLFWRANEGAPFGKIDNLNYYDLVRIKNKSSAERAIIDMTKAPFSISPLEIMQQRYSCTDAI